MDRVIGRVPVEKSLEGPVVADVTLVRPIRPTGEVGGAEVVTKFRKQPLDELTHDSGQIGRAR